MNRWEDRTRDEAGTFLSLSLCYWKASSFQNVRPGLIKYRYLAKAGPWPAVPVRHILNCVSYYGRLYRGPRIYLSPSLIWSNSTLQQFSTVDRQRCHIWCVSDWNRKGRQWSGANCRRKLRKATNRRVCYTYEKSVKSSREQQLGYVRKLVEDWAREMLTI